MEGLPCTRCAAASRATARFCAVCGTPFDGADGAVPPETEALPAAPRASLRAARDWVSLRSVAQLFVGYLVCSLVFGWMFRATSSPVLHALAGVCAAILTLVFVARGESDLGRAMDPRALRMAHLVPVAQVAAVWLPALFVYFRVLEALGVPMLQMTDDALEAGWPVWSLFVVSSLMPAVFEELAFRGVIFARLQSVLGEREALLIQAALFSVVHLLPLIFVSHFFMGYALGWLRVKTGSLYPGMLVHGAWNALVIYQELPG